MEPQLDCVISKFVSKRGLLERDWTTPTWNGLTHHYVVLLFETGSRAGCAQTKTVDSIISLLNAVMHKTGCQGCFRQALSKETGKAYFSNHSILNPFKPNRISHCY